jgi:hypothetical protein
MGVSSFFKGLFGRGDVGVSAHSTHDANSERAPLRELTLPKRPATRMESEVCADLRVHFDVSRPTREDLLNAMTLPQGSLHAIWTELRGAHGACVDAFFVGHGGHYQAPYVLLRAKGTSFYLLERVKAELQALPGAAAEQHSVSPDDVSVIVRFPRETGLFEATSDRQHIRRVAQLIALPPAEVDSVLVTRLILHSVPVKSVAGVDRLGDQPYTVSLACSTPRVSVSRDSLPAAA